jgi:integrase
VDAVSELVARSTPGCDVAVIEFPNGSDPWSVLVRAWLHSFREEHTTRRAYTTDARQWTEWCQGRGFDPFRPFQVHVDQWAEHITARGGHGGRPAAAKTLARKLAALGSLYKYAKRHGLVENNPLPDVDRPDVSRDYAATVSLDEAQTQAVVRAAREHSPVAHALVVTLALTGLRVAEALAADVTDLVDDHGYRCVNVTRKGGVKDRVTLPPQAAHVLAGFLGGRTDGPLFVDVAGARVTYSSARWMLDRIGRAAGLPASLALHPHMLRASFATISFDHGVGPDRIQDAMGHADPRTTRLYDRGREKLRRKAEPGNVVAKFVMPDDDEEVGRG